MSRFEPNADGGLRLRRSRRVRLSRPIDRERCVRMGSRIDGGFSGRGGSSRLAMEEGEELVGASGVGGATLRYHGICEESDREVGVVVEQLDVDGCDSDCCDADSSRTSSSSLGILLSRDWCCCHLMLDV